MKFTRLQIENVKRIKALDINLTEPLTIIRGRNAQGKSSALDSVAYLLGGKRAMPPEVIRRGEKYAQVIGTTDGDYVIKRRWTANDRSTITIKTKDGASYPAAQTLISELAGDTSFDPLKFYRMSAKEQAAVLRQLVGLDFSALDAKRAGLFEERAGVNRELSATQVLLDSTPTYPEAPAEPLSVSALLAEDAAARKVIGENDRLRAAVARDRQELEVALSKRDAAVDAVTRARDALRVAENALVEAKEEAARRAAMLLDAEEHIAQIEDPDLIAIRERLESVEEVNAKVASNARHAALEASFTAAHADSDRLTRELGQIDVEKARALAEAPFPVPGLSFDGDMVTFRGLPLEQAADSERLRVAVGIGLAMNPTLKVLLIRDGSLLDADSKAILAQMAEEAGAEVIVEIVSEAVAGEGIVIEDGQEAEFCPDCGRLKAFSADDAARGYCPKWWAINDTAAEADCRRHQAGEEAGLTDESATEHRDRLRSQYRFPRSCGDNGLAETRELAGLLSYAQHDDELHGEDRS